MTQAIPYQPFPNSFKRDLLAGKKLIGIWSSLANEITTEALGVAGFDWVVLDGEHSPTDIPRLLAQAQALAAYPGTHAIARVPMGHGHLGEMLIKQYLDIGIQTLLVPMVDTPEQAAALVRAMRYPQAGGGGGIRGMAGARASRWGRYPEYAHEANAQVCLLVQAETQAALNNLDAIAATEGVDGVFIGPADLSASMGHVGNASHPEVQAAIENAIARIIKAGKAAGILTADEALAHHYLSLGATFVAVGLDTGLLARHTSALAARFKNTASPVATPGQTY